MSPGPVNAHVLSLAGSSVKLKPSERISSPACERVSQLAPVPALAVLPAMIESVTSIVLSRLLLSPPPAAAEALLPVIVMFAIATPPNTLSNSTPPPPSVSGVLAVAGTSVLLLAIVLFRYWLVLPSSNTPPPPPLSTPGPEAVLADTVLLRSRKFWPNW